MPTIAENEVIVVLLALGNQEEAELIEAKLLERFRDNMEVYQAPTGFDAMSLSMNKPHIVLLDQRLPDVMGLDMIESIREQIGLDKYLLFIGGAGKAGMRPGMRDEALKRGATTICERPLDADWIVKMLHQLVYPEVPDHPHLHGLELLDLIQMFNQKRCDRTMRIFTLDGRVGSIYMNKGEITHVEAGSQRGFDAVLSLMRWTEGRIYVYDSLLSAERTNDQPTMHLIMEAARMMDEGTSHDPEPEPEPSNALEAMEAFEEDFLSTVAIPEPGQMNTPHPLDDHSFADDDESHKKKKDDTLSIPALDLDFDLD
ncbi:MAG: DUF4388 domain-containing protein [Sumerlaeia bacterium]